MEARTLVIGLGNPILGDDGVGWRVADLVERDLGRREDLAVVRVGVGGLRLMEMMVGWDRAVIVDAIDTGTAPAGTVTTVPLPGLRDPGAGHTASPHDVSLAAALALGRTLGAPLPAEITVVAIEASPNLEFSDHLSPPVGAAVPRAAAAVWSVIGREGVVPRRTEETGHGVT
jgi:hydrogenase maturation protease